MTEYSTPKYKIGDKVKVVKYGHLIYEFDGKGKNRVIDMKDDIVGKSGIIREVIQPQPGYIQYSLLGIPEKVAWYNEDQLELEL